MKTIERYSVETDFLDMLYKEMVDNIFELVETEINILDEPESKIRKTMLKVIKVEFKALYPYEEDKWLDKEIEDIYLKLKTIKTTRIGVVENKWKKLTVKE